MIIIASFAVWFCLKGLNNLVVITSASHAQLKYQTEVHIKELVNRVNRQFGHMFHSIEFYHVCERTASEIKLFATDEPGKAEGYHPRLGGELAIVINEAKSVEEEIFESLTRCTGYSYWLEVSSPAGKQGHFYRTYLDSIPYPDPPILGKPFFRKVSAYDCPHIPVSHIERAKATMTEWWFKSSILAEFTDFGESIVIPEEIWLRALNNNYLDPHDTKDIGIGLDLAAGGDENACYVRMGPTIVDAFAFRQKDTTITPEVIDRRLSKWKSLNYIFYADDGGIGRAIIDRLVQKGWHVSRLHNQSAARNKKEFLNIGAEMYFHLKRLFENGYVRPYTKDPLLKAQLTSRYYDQLESGKFRLEKKSDARQRTQSSPDRADAYVLCYYSYRPENQPDPEAPAQRMSLEEFEWKLSWGRLSLKNKLDSYGRPTSITGNI